MIKQLATISSLLILFLAITPQVKAQDTAVMTISVKVISGTTVTSEINPDMDLQGGKFTFGQLDLLGDKQQGYLVSIDQDVQISNSKGKAIHISTSFSEMEITQRDIKRYHIVAEVEDRVLPKSGVYKGEIKATINYL